MNQGYVNMIRRIDSLRPAEVSNIVLQHLSTLTPAAIQGLVEDLNKRTTEAEIVNPNLLINGDFRINQRGYVSGTATTYTNQYTVDRWRVVTVGQALTLTPTLQGNQVTAPSGGMEQVIEGSVIRGGVYTLIWTGTAMATVNGTPILNGGKTANLPANTNVVIRFRSGTINLAKFERGLLKTPFEPALYSDELSRCQRYCVTIDVAANTPIGIGLSVGKEEGIAWISLPGALRTLSAAVTYVGNLVYAEEYPPQNPDSGWLITGRINTFNTLQLSHAGLRRLSVGKAGWFSFYDSPGKIIIDAEL
jgi:hypothetical protein